MDNRKINICIVSHMAYGALKGGESGHAGGVEFQTSLLAKWLAKRGQKVSLITWDEGGRKEETVDGVRVIKLCRAEEGIPGIRFFHPRWSSLIKALKRADADIYYHNVGEYVTGQLALWCRIKRRRFIYYIASDDECTSIPLRDGRFYDRFSFVLGLKNSDCVIAQTRHQKKMLAENLGLHSKILPMPCTYDIRESEVLPYEGRTLYATWIGRISKEKRLEWLLEVAELLPSIKFEVIGKFDPYDSYAISLVNKMSSMSNVFYHGMIPHNELTKFYKNALVLCNTSSYEGFPNTFIEAWGFGLPVVSAFDPDDLIKEKGIGYYVNSINEFAAAITQVMNSKEQWQTFSNNSREYYLKNHLSHVALERFEKLFLKVVEQKHEKN